MVLQQKPSLLEQQRADEAQSSACNAQRLILLTFITALGLLAFSAMNAPPRRVTSSSDIARHAMQRRSLHASQIPATTIPPPPPPPPPAPMPAGVVDAKCHARLHTDYMGERAPVWGLGKPGFHLNSAAECCAACQAHAAACGGPDARNKAWWPARPELRCGNNPGCNVWVFCPEKQCFAFDIHVHEFGECWLKQQRANITAPKDPHEGHTRFPAAMRKSPRKEWPWAVDEKIWAGGIPEEVPWISGVLAPEGATVRSAPADDPWRRNWCKRHGAKYGGCSEYDLTLVR